MLVLSWLFPLIHIVKYSFYTQTDDVMLSDIKLVSRLSEAVHLQHECLCSSAEEEELHGAAPDQEEKKVSLAPSLDRFFWLISEEL